MRRTQFALAVAGAALLAFPAMAADKPDFGKREYESNCMVCHGKQGKGDGPYAGFVADNQGGSDLTTLAKKNGGVFPILRVTETIDGRHLVKAHGPRDMPIWGQDYLERAESAFFGYGLSREAFARSRILALIDYLHRLQAE